MPKKSTIRPPRKPRGENPKTTIANQEKQIKLLIDRCEELRKDREAERDAASRYMEEGDMVRVEASQNQDAINGLLLDKRRLELDLSRANGYIARVREEDKHRYGDLGASA